MRSTMSSKRIHKQNTLLVILQKIGVAAFWIALWYGISRLVQSELLLPSPIDVAKRLGELIPTSDFWLSVAASMGRMLWGYLLGTVCGFVLAFVTHWSRLARELLSPVFTVVRATPVSSFILIAIIMIGSSSVPVLTAFLMVLPVVWNGVSAALAEIGPELPEMAAVFRLSRASRMRYLYFPAVRGGFLSACVTSVGLAWKACVAAEVLCVSRLSIGRNLYLSKLYLESVDLFAWTVTVIVLSLILEFALRRILHRFSGNRGGGLRV